MLLDMLHSLFVDMWKQEKMLKDWHKSTVCCMFIY